jgi:hypothetical protein
MGRKWLSWWFDPDDQLFLAGCWQVVGMKQEGRL